MAVCKPAELGRPARNDGNICALGSVLPWHKIPLRKASVPDEAAEEKDFTTVAQRAPGSAWGQKDLFVRVVRLSGFERVW